jgi:hypothetical protein
MSNHQLMVCIAAMTLLSANGYADTTKPNSASSSSTSTAAVTTSKKNSKPSSTAAAAAPAVKTSNDRLELDTTTVTGNRELPKVQYIVPWKKADVGNLPGQPFNTLLDEALTPVDREVFRREVDYYQAVSNKDQPGKGFAGARNGAQPATQSDAK